MKYLRSPAACQYLEERHGYRVTPGYLNKLASVGGGPLFYKRGHFREYTAEHLDAWIEEKRSGPFRSTSDTARTSEAA